MMEDKPQRTALYVPASNQRAIEKSRGIDADWIIFDLEDAVAEQSKDTARQAIKDALKGGDFGRSQIAIRCNHVSEQDFPLDLAVVAACRPQAVLLPKVSSVADVDLFDSMAKKIDLDPQVSTWFMIETAKGLAQLNAVVERGIKLNWPLHTLVVGHNDIASETGVSLDHDRRYLVPWLMHVVLQAKQANLHVLDSVWNRFRDLDGFEAEARQGCEMGFDGKTLIHPSQVEPANQIFSPGKKEIERARLIVESFALSENANLNVVNINGEMVERLHLLQAEKLLQKFSFL